MDRIRRKDTELVARLVATHLGQAVTLASRNGYYVVERGDSGRVLKSGTLRECDTYLHGMYEALNIVRYG